MILDWRPIAKVLNVEFMIKVHEFNQPERWYSGYTDEPDALSAWRSDIYSPMVQEAWLYARHGAGEPQLVRSIC